MTKLIIYQLSRNNIEYVVNVFTNIQVMIQQGHQKDVFMKKPCQKDAKTTFIDVKIGPLAKLY